MHISWHGASCVKLQTGDTTVIIDPYDNSVGLSMPKLKASIAVSTNLTDPFCNNLERLQGEPQLVTTPGEFEISGVFFYGIPYQSDRTLYIIEAEGMVLAHLGNDAPELSDTDLERFEAVDILFLPVTSASAKQRDTLVNMIEPRLIIPIAYSTKGTKGITGDLAEYRKASGLGKVDSEKKLVLKASQLPTDNTDTVLLDVV